MLPFTSFGGLERINLRFCDRRSLDNMRCKVAITGFPFQRRIRTSCAVPFGRKLSGPIAAIALLHDLVANPAIVGTPLCRHKRALDIIFNGCTNQLNHPLSVKNQKKGLGHLSPALYERLEKTGGI
jgi:hypothetical protein